MQIPIKVGRYICCILLKWDHVYQILISVSLCIYKMTRIMFPLLLDKNYFQSKWTDKRLITVGRCL